MAAITGSNGDDAIDGGDGDDKIVGGNGDDILDGGDGDDRLVGGAGDDILIGGEGDDKLTGSSGDDLFDFTIGFGSDEITDFKAGAGTIDRILLRDTEATSFADVLALASDVGGSVVISFSTGDTLTLKGVSVADLHGDDFIFETTLPDLFTINSDIVDFNAVVAGSYVEGTQYDALGGDDVVILATNAIEAAEAGYVVGTAFNAGDGNDTVTGGDLDDTVDGGNGNDVLDGGSGVDALSGGAGDDRLILGDIDTGETVDGGTGTDTFVFAASDGADHRIEVRPTEVEYDVTTTISVTNIERYELSGGDGNDLIIVGAAVVSDDVLYGNAGNDLLRGGFGLDVLFGGDGNDALQFNDATAGDLADGGAGIDRLDFFAVGANDDVIVVNANNVTVGGVAITMVDIERVNIEGGFGNDTITGGANADTLRGQADDDTISGGGGNDVIQGGTGVDVLMGDAGDDTLSMNDANVGDSVDGGTGNDTFNYIADGNANNITINPGNVTVDGVAILVANIETVDINAGAGNDIVTGGVGNDILRGEADDDTLTDGGGADIIQGGAGNDTIVLQDGNDTIDGGAGNDTLEFQTASLVSVNLVAGTATLAGADTVTFSLVENVVGGSANDVFVTTAPVVNSINGSAGFDRLIITGGGDATVDLIAGTVSVAGPDAGTFSVAGIEWVGTGAGNDTLTGDGATNRFDAGTGSDTISAGGGDDIIFVNDGDDAIDGGGGLNDTLFLATAGNTTVDLAAGTLLMGADPLSTVVGIENIQGGGDVDDITGDANNNLLIGNGGNDIIDGGAGADIITGNAGDDTLSGGDGNDRLLGGTGNDFLDGGTGSDTILMGVGDGADTVTGFVAGAGTDDVVDLQAFGFSAFDDGTLNDVESALSQSGADVFLDLGGGDSLTFLNTLLGNFHADDFVI